MRSQSRAIAINMNYKTPAEFIGAADSQLDLEDWHGAWKIATEGLEHYPDHAELQKYADILAPPKVRVVPRDRSRDVQANLEWIQQNRAEYRGRWVAIKNGEFLASGKDIDEIVGQIGEVKNTGILVTAIC